jgi:hypothetical protein
MVAVPTSKLRLAEASCSAVAALGARRGQRVLGRQDVEVGLRDAHHQVLVGSRPDRPAVQQRLARLFDGRPLARLNSG